MRPKKQAMIVAAQEQAIDSPGGGEPTLMQIMGEAVRAGNVEIVERLVALQERMERWSAEKSFKQAKARLYPRLPQVTETGTIMLNSGKVRNTYAENCDIDLLIRPLLAEEGFSLSFDSEVTPTGIVVIGVLSHIDGHQELKKTPPLPPDTGGGKSAIDAIAATITRGQRMVLKMHLNLVTRPTLLGHSDGPLTDEQAADITVLLKALEESGWSGRKKFLEWVGAEHISDIRQSSYPRARDMLARKLNEAHRR